jgi:hypothetical protein
MAANHLLIDLIPPPQAVRYRLGDALREVELLRRLLRLADLADHYRRLDRHDCPDKREGGKPCHT